MKNEIIDKIIVASSWLFILLLVKNEIIHKTIVASSWLFILLLVKNEIIDKIIIVASSWLFILLLVGMFPSPLMAIPTAYFLESLGIKGQTHRYCVPIGVWSDVLRNLHPWSAYLLKYILGSDM